MDEELEFTDEEKHGHYQYICNTIEFLENGGRITEDWVTEHKEVIEAYRDWIADYSRINPECETMEFRKLCHETETLMNYLMTHLIRTNKIETKVYLMLIKHMKKIIDMIQEDDDMEELMNGLSM